MMSSKFNNELFAINFLKEYGSSGFANLSKREIDLLVLRLVLQCTEGWSVDDPPTAFELSRALRIRRSRIRLMLDELSFRSVLDQEDTKKRLKNIILRHQKDVDGNKVKIQIEDGYLRDYAKDVVQSQYGIVDTSFDRSIISLSSDKFLVLVDHIADQDVVGQLSKELAKVSHQSRDEDRTPLLAKFVDELVKSAGQEAGKKVIELGFSVLTGGLSEVPGYIKVIKSMFLK